MSRIQRIALVLAIIGLSGLIVEKSWLTDDSYISFRTADNFVHGYGLRWNIDERVQPFTSPLWTLVFAVFHALTHEAFYTAQIVQIAISVLAVWWLSTRVASDFTAACIAPFVLALSKTFVDYSTGGLENPLAHLLLFVFAAWALRLPRTPRMLGVVTFGASMVALNRLDASLLVFPAVALRARDFVRARGERRAALVALAVGLLPLIGWELFSIVYYGFPFPNTAYAKIASGLPRSEYILAGLRYFENAMLLDPLLLVTIVAALAVAIINRQRDAIALGVGVVLSSVYVVWVGGDFMSGRFLTPAFAVAVAVLAHGLGERPNPAKFSWLGASVLIAATTHFDSISDAYQVHAMIKDAAGISDARREAEGMRLLSPTGGPLPRHRWVDEGLALKRQGREVAVKGGVGLLGFYAGPEPHIIDKFALVDPLLARLPIPDAKHEQDWRPGHLIRVIPTGYVEHLRSPRIPIHDQGLDRYNRHLEALTRGSLFSAARCAEIVRMNLGVYSHLLDHYIAYQDIKRVRATETTVRRSRLAGHYSWWIPGGPGGVEFTSTGLLVEVDRRPATELDLRLTPGNYRIAWWQGSNELAHAELRATSSELRVPIPPQAQNAFDGVFIRPESPTPDIVALGELSLVR